MDKLIKILHVEDLETDATLVKRELKKGGLPFESLWVSSKEAYEKALEEFDPDIVLCDHSLPSFTSTDALQILKSRGKRIPFILITATVSEDLVVSMMKYGIDDYILKDRLQRLPNAVLNALEKVEAEKDKEKYYNEVITQEKRFRALIENLAEAIILLDVDGVVTYQSPSATRVTGFTSDENVGKNVFDSFHPDDRSEAERLFKKAFNTPETPIEESFRLRHKNGSYVWVEGTITNLLHDESVKGFIVNYRDVTERRQAEKELKKSEANLRTIYNNTDVSYILLDVKYNILAFNDVTRQILGSSLGKDFGEGKNLMDFVPGDDEAAMKKRLSEVINGKKVGYEVTLQNEKGISWLCVNLLPVSGEDKTVLGIIVSIENITDRKSAELEREKMTQDLVQHNKNLEQFAYIISHNLRSPVANIIGLSNMIHSTPDMSREDFDRCMDGLAVSVKKLDDTIIDLNYILQIRREINEKKEIVRFSSLVKDIKTSINNLIEKEKITIQTNFKEINEFFTIKSYLNSIFYNLISNSIKYRDPSRPSVIEIKSLVRNKKLVLVFKDNGLGIDMSNNKDKIFGLYKKFHPQIEGKGMGLYMVKTQVEILGGRIDIMSEVGVGTEFMIEFDLPK
jgi:PAS domain S-box-containing protein